LLPHLDAQTPVYGLQARGVEDASAHHASLEEMASCYVGAIREIQPRGPYRLLGWSFGGRVAQEMARQLEAQGDSVALLVAMDTMFDSITGSEGGDPAQGAESMDADEVAYRDLQDMARQGRSDFQALEMPLMQRLIAFRRHASTLTRSHEMSQVQASVLYFRAAGNDRALSDELARVTRGAVEVIDIDASHSDMLNPEPAAIIAGHLNRVLSHLLLPPPASQ